MQVAVRGRAVGRLHCGYAQRPDVAFGVVPVGFVRLDHLGRHPEGGAGERPPLVPAESLGQGSRDAEIGEADLARRGEQHVRALDVSVDLPLAVEVVERVEEISADDSARGLRERAAEVILDEVRDAPARHVLHRDREARGPGVEPAAEVLGHERRGALHQVRDLALDVFHLVLRLLQVHELDRDDIVGELIARGVDVARAAAADPRTEFEPLARQRHPKLRDNFSLAAWLSKFTRAMAPKLLRLVTFLVNPQPLFSSYQSNLLSVFSASIRSFCTFFRL